MEISVAGAAAAIGPWNKNGYDDEDGDYFDKTDWENLKGFMEPLVTQRRVKSQKFRHHHRVIERNNLSMNTSL
jgi:hypothetical protein